MSNQGVRPHCLTVAEIGHNLVGMGCSLSTNFGGHFIGFNRLICVASIGLQLDQNSDLSLNQNSNWTIIALEMSRKQVTVVLLLEVLWYVTNTKSKGKLITNIKLDF